MRKLIASINMTLDGFCDHTAMIADDELHRHFNELFKSADTVLYGRTTYQLMEAGWPPIVQHPTGKTSMDEFAVLIDNIEKVVFSETLRVLPWKNSRLAARPIQEEIKALRSGPGKNILAGSPGLIAALSATTLIDEYQIALQPIVLGKGLPLFKNITEKLDLKLLHTKTLVSGVIILYYARK